MKRTIWKISAVLGIPRCKKLIPKSYFRCDLEFERVQFYSRKCKKMALLQGWYFVSQNSNRCIIIAQGYGKHWLYPEKGMPEITETLVKNGYNVLVLDLRVHGESGGKKTSLGCYETYDLLGACDFVINERNILPQNIGFLGFSFGAMVSIFAASREKIGAIMVDSCPGDIAEFVKKIMKMFRIPLFFFSVSRWLVNSFFGINIDGLNTKEAAKKISAPILFIYGKNDIFLYASIRESYQIKKKHPLDRIWVTDSFHSESFEVSPKEYLKNTIEFFDKALKPASK